MARESKRKREAKRLGEGRLIDKVLNQNWKMLLGFNWSKPEHVWLDETRENIRLAKIVVADNVSEYYFAVNEKSTVYAKDFPCCTPPYENLWIEMQRPSCLRFEDKIESSHNYPAMWGWHFKCCGMKQLSERILRAMTRSGIDTTGNYFEFPDHIRWVVDGTLFAQVEHNVAPIATTFMLLAEDGSMAMPPRIDVLGSESCTDSESLRLTAEICSTMFYPSLLTVSFMHCKNVTTTLQEPTREFDRHRRNAGMKPLSRYNTINIEPMKRVLRTEGKIESNGLTKALHIVRGHMARYTEEKPLFGKHTGTFWKPAHVRGSIKEGVVFSDYEVK